MAKREEDFGLRCGCNVQVFPTGMLRRTYCARCSAEEELSGGEEALPGLSAKRLAASVQDRDALAAALGWPTEDVDAACSGRYPLTLDDVQAWAGVCGCSMRSLFDGVFIPIEVA